MNNFELIDDYLTDRLDKEEKVAFENKLNSDPALKADVDFQRQILEGIKKGRALELKSMLNKVPVSSGNAIHFSIARLAASILITGAVGAAAYYFIGSKEAPNMKNASTDLLKKSEQIQTQNKELPNHKQEEIKIKEKPAIKAENLKSEPKNVAKPNATKAESHNIQPRLEVMDPSKEMASEENEPASSSAVKSSVSISHIDVETDLTNKNYHFHYQFVGGKLYLYGPFDRNLYEILEINGDHQILFLFYKENYYLLDGKQLKVTELEPITDANLIKKLKEYRNN